MESFRNGEFRFEVTDTGPESGDPVILLHGFPADRLCWDAVTPPLVAAGYRCLAPDQRGYSAGARPRGRAAYRFDRLGGDILALADEIGAKRFHVVGHDWGAVVAWYLAGCHPDRVRSLVAVSVPHPGAVLQAVRGGTQALHSWYMLAFQLPGVERILARRGGEDFRKALRRSGLGPEPAGRYAARAAEGGLTGPLGWYRALPLAAGRVHVPASPVPTTLVWGSGDKFVTRRAAQNNASFATGAYDLLELDASHWLPEEHPSEVARAVLTRLASAD